MQTANLTDLLNDLNVTLTAENPRADMEGDWPHIACTAVIKRPNRRDIVVPYKQGVGHIDWNKAAAIPLITTEYADLMARGVRLSAETQLAAVRDLLARRPALWQRPTAADVVSSLALDAEAMHQTFDDWCANFGYETDSRRALSLYTTCQTNGARLRAMFTPDEFATVLAAASEY